MSNQGKKPFQPWFRGRGGGGGGRAGGFKSKPIMTKSGNSNFESEEFDINDASFKIQREKNCPYDEWKLYFPKKSEYYIINKFFLKQLIK